MPQYGNLKISPKPCKCDNYDKTRSLFDPKVTGSLGLSQDTSDSEYSTLAHFPMSLIHKHVNLKEPYNQDVKEQVTTKEILKKKTGFT